MSREAEGEAFSPWAKDLLAFTITVPNHGLLSFLVHAWYMAWGYVVLGCVLLAHMLELRELMTFFSGELISWSLG